MREVAEKHKDRLSSIKESIEEAFLYYEKNYENFQEFMRFVFVSTLTDEDESKLAELGKPPLTFNILEAFVSKLRGEFMTHEPSVSVRAADGMQDVDMTDSFMHTISIVEAHLREILTNNNNDELAYQVYTDLLGGGFSCVEIYTEYINNKSFEQNIRAERVFSPCLTGFDPMARKSHKGDGRFCFQIIPRTKQAFEDEFGKDAAKDIKFTRDLKGFNWSYKNDKKEIILVADFYEKKIKEKKIVKLSNDKVMLKSEYDDDLKRWEENAAQNAVMELPPVIVDERMAPFETICRYRIYEDAVLDYIETDYEHLPLVFFDGNSVNVQRSKSGDFEQVTRPYAYNAKGAQKLKDFAGQTVANEIENMMQSKLMAPLEGIPMDYQEAYTNYQDAQVIVYNAFLDGNPEVRVPPPTEVQRVQTPQIVAATFAESDKMTQTILGSYDAQASVQSAGVSGKAIMQGNQNNNSASQPYMMGYIRGLNRAAEIIVSLIPKYYKTPRSIPILLPDGKRTYKMVNTEDRAEQAQQQQMQQMQQMQMQQQMQGMPQQQQGQQQPGMPQQQGQPGQQMQGQPGQQMPQQQQQPEQPKEEEDITKGSVYMNYEPHSLMVKVEAGASYGSQKQMAVEQITSLMRISPLINQFISEEGIEILLDNVEFRGSDRLKVQVEQFIKKYQAKKEKQDKMQEQQQMSELQMKQGVAQAQIQKGQTDAHKVQLQEMDDKFNRKLDMFKVILQKSVDEAKGQTESAKVSIANRKVDVDLLGELGGLEAGVRQMALREEEVDAENARTAVTAAIDISKHQHEVAKDIRELQKDDT